MEEEEEEEEEEVVVVEEAAASGEKKNRVARCLIHWLRGLWDCSQLSLCVVNPQHRNILIVSN